MPVENVEVDPVPVATVRVDMPSVAITKGYLLRVAMEVAKYGEEGEPEDSMMHTFGEDVRPKPTL